MNKYCESTCQTKRWKTREVMVGNIGVGGLNPVRIQSMTTSSTRDILATVDQVMQLADAGCEIVRVTVQGIKEAEACEHIKTKLIQKGYSTPLVADIHFFPAAAMHVVDFVDKVRVNPGNFVDRRASFKSIVYNDFSYAKEVERIEEKFGPLVEKCKSLKKAIRIGANHGSLSDRIMNRYGDTPQGMVESALEFARVCRQHDFHDFIFSMKSSNPQVMILAYRLLVSEMLKLGWDYPLHLGVTEAGAGEDGRIKSAMGIGSLLLDGLGDTIRISLTEDAWHEIEPCRRLIAFAASYRNQSGHMFTETGRQFTALSRREVVWPKHINMHTQGTVVVPVAEKDLKDPQFYQQLGCDVKADLPKLKKISADAILLEKVSSTCELSVLQKLKDAGISVFTSIAQTFGISVLSLAEAVSFSQKTKPRARFELYVQDSIKCIQVTDEDPSLWPSIKSLQPEVIFLAPTKNRLHYCRHFFDWLQAESIKAPVILHFNYHCSQEELIIQAAAECGALLCDFLGEGICLSAPIEIDFLRSLSFNILQAARMRTFKTDFISCPSCGRTLFDLQEVSARIRRRTGHLSGVKIAIMGCIVNGPGEMADADFGYVGSKPGMIDLYVGKQCVEKDIDFAQADERLVALIKSHGRWSEA